MRYKASVKIALIFLLISFNTFPYLQAYTNNSRLCSDYVSMASSLNAYKLWEGATDCKKSNQDLESTFLLIAGQIRATTDMQILKGVSDEEKMKMSELWGQLYYYFGGSGPAQLHRNSSSKEKLFKSLQEWNAKIDNKYSPGWNYKLDIDSSRYHQMIACQKAIRLSKLKWYSGLINNDTYYDASKELKKLLKQNEGPITVGTKSHKRMMVLRSQMSDISSKTPLPNEGARECDPFNKHERPSDTDFTQVHDGYNGPNSSRAEAFDSREEIMGSWIPNSLSNKQLSTIIDDINFDKEILVSLSFGKRTTATGNTYISEIDYNSVMKSLSIVGMIGVNISECKEDKRASYPFVLAIAPRPKKTPDYPSMFLQNFPDGCKPTKSGTPTVEPK